MKRKLLPLVLMLCMLLASCGNQESDETLCVLPKYETMGIADYTEYFSFFEDPYIMDDPESLALYGGHTLTYVDNVTNGKLPVLIPKLNGEYLPLREEEGFSGITIFPEELFDWIWTWFHFDSNLSVRISLLSDEDQARAKEMTCVVFLKEKHQSDEMKYTALSLSLRGKTVDAARMTTSDGRVYTYFIDAGALICVYTNSQPMTDEWFAQLEFQQVYLTE